MFFLKSKTLAFSSILLGVTDLGMTMTPLWICHRMRIWATLLPSRVEIALSLGSSIRLRSPSLAQGLSGEPSGE